MSFVLVLVLHTFTGQVNAVADYSNEVECIKAANSLKQEYGDKVDVLCLPRLYVVK